MTEILHAQPHCYGRAELCRAFGSVAVDSMLTRLSLRAPGVLMTRRWPNGLNRFFTKVGALMALGGCNGCCVAKGFTVAENGWYV